VTRPISIVGATAKHRFQQGWISRQRRAPGVGERHARNVNLGSDGRSAAQFGEVAGKSIRHIHGRGCVL
jgi:hypothetical protein